MIRLVHRATRPKPSSARVIVGRRGVPPCSHSGTMLAQEWVEQVPGVVANVMAGERYPANAAIAAARVTTLALAELGIADARAVGCQLDAASAATLAMLEEASRLGVHPNDLPVAARERWLRQGAVWVSLVNESPGPDFSGHVLTILESAWILDPTLGQASRPQQGMELGPLAHQLVDGPAADGPLLIRLENGNTLLYRLELGPTDFRTAPDWLHVGRLQSTITSVVRLLRDLRPHSDATGS